MDKYNTFQEEKQEYVFSFFKGPISNCIPEKEPLTLRQLSEIIKSDKFKSVIESLRSEPDRKKRAEIKHNLPYVTPAGTFTRRADDCMIERSGLICLDIDHLSGMIPQRNPTEVKKSILANTTPAFMHNSPLGDGLKVYHAIDVTQGTHEQYFKALQEFYASILDIPTQEVEKSPDNSNGKAGFDTAVNDISRACFLSYDHEAFYSEYPQVLGESFLETFTYNEPEVTPEYSINCGSGNSPFEDYNNKADIIALMEAHGWKVVFTKGERIHLLRPGNTDSQTSGNFHTVKRTLVIFSSSAHPFEPRKGYNPTQVFTLLECDGDYSSASKKLYEMGYGDRRMTEPAASKTRIKKQANPIQQFPIDGLPELLRSLITECVDVYKTPRDFWAAAFFAGTAAGMGNSVKLSGKYVNNCAMWWMLVAPSGTGKSEPLDFAFNPFNKLDGDSYRDYMTQKTEYENIMKLSKKERESHDIHETPPLPVCRQTILKDFTPEAMAGVHGNNPRGIVLHRDELMGWINDIGRYTKSGEVETMLTLWSGKGLVVNRKGQGPLRIDDPCITIAGGVQVKKLIDLTKDGRADNGMIQRCMFLWPDFCEKQKYSIATLPPEHISAYEDYINRLLSIPEGNIISLSDKAESLYAEFYNDNVDKANAEEVDFIKEVYAKLDIIVLRIALMVHGMKIVCDGITSDTIDPETMEYAIRVTEYFRATALKVYDQLSVNTGSKITTKDIIYHLRYECGITNQSQIAKFLNVSQQYVNKIFSGRS